MGPWWDVSADEERSRPAALAGFKEASKSVQALWKGKAVMVLTLRHHIPSTIYYIPYTIYCLFLKISSPDVGSTDLQLLDLRLTRHAPHAAPSTC